MYFPYISWFSDGVSTKFQPFYKDNFHIGRWCLRMVPPSLVRPIGCEWQTNDACSPARRWKKLAGSGTCGACKQVKCMDGGMFWLLVGGYLYIIYIIYYIHFILYIIYCNLYITYFNYIYIDNILFIYICFSYLRFWFSIYICIYILYVTILYFYKDIYRIYFWFFDIYIIFKICICIYKYLYIMFIF